MRMGNGTYMIRKEVSNYDLTNKEISELKLMINELTKEVDLLNDGSNEEYSVFANKRIDNLTTLLYFINDYEYYKPSDQEIETARLKYTE